MCSRLLAGSIAVDRGCRCPRAGRLRRRTSARAFRPITAATTHAPSTTGSAWRNRGDPAAEAGIGFLFHKGLGVTQDDAEAATWFVKAAEQGQAEAQLLLGTLFFFGKGVPQSYVTAFAWCDIAGTNGQSDASECRDAALEHMTPAEMAQSFKIVSDWLGRHPRTGALSVALVPVSCSVQV